MKIKSLKSKLKRIKILQHIAGVVAVVGGFLLIGTVGGLECDTIGLGQAFIQFLVFGIATWLAAECLMFLESYSEDVKEEIRCEIRHSIRMGERIYRA